MFPLKRSIYYCNFKPLKERFMSSEDLKRMVGYLKEAQKSPRSKKEITQTFEAAGIIDKKGNLKKPYKNIYIPVGK